MKSKKILSTLLVASIFATAFIQPSSIKADAASSNDSKEAILEQFKESSGDELRVSEQPENKNQMSVSGKLSQRENADGEEAEQFLDESKNAFSLKDIGDNFSVKSTEKDDLGFTHVTFTQIYDNMPVENSSLTVHFNKDNVITNVTTNVDYDVLNSHISLKDNVSEGQALEKVKSEFTQPDAKIEAEDSVVLHKDSNIFGTYKFNVQYKTPEIGNYTVYIDKNTGNVVDKVNNIKGETAVKGSGKAVNGTTRSLNLVQDNNTYKTIDTTKDMSGQIITYNMNGSTQSGQVFSSNSSTITDPAVVSAHSYAGVVYDFYKTLFNRNSLDNAGMTLKSFVHYGSNYNNAFWDGSEMVYGDGDGSQFTYLSGDLDVVAHEMSHGITERTCDLQYSYQSGALNESMSDVLGVLIQTWDKYNVANGGEWKFNPSDWVVGDEVYTPGIDGDALRSLADPAKYDQPADMNSYVNTYSDNGGVHTNSGIPNKAAFNIAKSLGCEKTAKIYYRALVNYFNQNTDFKGALNGLVQSATDIYGANSNEVQTVISGFKAVGIESDTSTSGGSTGSDSGSTGSGSGSDSGSTDPTTPPTTPGGNADKNNYEPNDSLKQAYEIKSGEVIKSYLQDSNDVDFYKISVPFFGRLHVTLTNLPYDYDVYVYTSSGSLVGKSVNNGTANEELTTSYLWGGYYYIQVKKGASGYSADHPYTLQCSTY